jgi:hypothetical protein
MASGAEASGGSHGSMNSHVGLHRHNLLRRELDELQHESTKSS